MWTKAILALTLSKLILLIPASCADNQTAHNHTTPLSPLPNTTTTSAEASGDESGSSPTLTGITEESDTKQNGTTPTPTSSFSSSSIVTSPLRTTDQLNQAATSVSTKTKAPPPSKSINSKLMLFVILLTIMVLMLFVGCLHAMRDRESGQDSSVHRFLLGVRNRMRATIGNLEARMGFRLWPGGKRGGVDDETEEGQGEEGGQRIGGSCGPWNKEKGEHEEDSDHSHDSSSMEGDNLREKVPSRREEEERKHSGNEDGEEMSSASEGGQSAVEGESSGDKNEVSEEIALVNSVQEDNEKTDLCDITIL